MELLTVFSGEPAVPVATDWDRRTGFADSAESMAARRKEERVAFAKGPHVVRELGLLDLQYLKGSRSSIDTEVIRSTVDDWAAGGVGTIAAPAGAGTRGGLWGARFRRAVGPRPVLPPHPDHLTVLDAALEAVVGIPRLDLLLYEEFPYSIGGSGERQAEAVARRTRRRSIPVSVAVSRQAKAERIAAYESQMAVLSTDVGRLDDPGNLPTEERYWLFPSPTRPMPGG